MRYILLWSYSGLGAEIADELYRDWDQTADNPEPEHGLVVGYHLEEHR